jgi:hypothetical protein
VFVLKLMEKQEFEQMELASKLKYLQDIRNERLIGKLRTQWGFKYHVGWAKYLKDCGCARFIDGSKLPILEDLKKQNESLVKGISTTINNKSKGLTHEFEEEFSRQISGKFSGSDLAVRLEGLLRFLETDGGMYEVDIQIRRNS